MRTHASEMLKPVSQSITTLVSSPEPGIPQLPLQSPPGHLVTAKLRNRDLKLD